MRLSHPPKSRVERHYLVSGKTVEDVQPLFAADDKARLPQLLQVLGGIGDRRPGQGCELLDASVCLGEELENLNSDRTRERGTDARQIGKDRSEERRVGKE